TLVEKAGVPVHCILTDREAVLDLRQRVDMPVVWIAGSDDSASAGRNCVRSASRNQGAVVVHPRFPDDVSAVQDLLDGLEGCLDVTEPFLRIREAIGEARKMGVTNRG